MEFYNSTHFYNGAHALVFKWWLNRVAVKEDASGLTSEEWDLTQDAYASHLHVAMLINSSQLHAAGFKLKEVLPPQLEAVARGRIRTCGDSLKKTKPSLGGARHSRQGSAQNPRAQDYWLAMTGDLVRSAPISQRALERVVRIAVLSVSAPSPPPALLLPSPAGSVESL